MWRDLGGGCSRFGVAAILSLGFVLLGLAWLFSTPPFRAPDETAHYLRVLMVSDGTVLGAREPVDAAGLALLQGGGWRAAEERWIDYDRRGVVVPAALSPPGGVCFGGGADVHGRCTEVTYTGDYSPLAYLAPAVAIAPAGSASTALWLARAASLVVALAWLVVAFVLAGPALSWVTVGLLAATTPTTLFVAAVVNPSGLEIAANLAFISALSRLCRDGARMPRWAWWALALSGATTILAWQLGLPFALVDVLAVGALLGRRSLRRVRVEAPVRLASAGAVLALAAAASVVYGEVSGSLHSSVSFRPFGLALSRGAGQLAPTLRGAVGVFGALTVPLPGAMIDVWWAFVAAILIGALRVGGRRDRATLIAVTVVALAFPILFFAFSYRLSGFGMQGRYAMPILALIPTCSGVTLARACQARGSAAVMRLCLVGIAVFQVIAWWVNARHWSTTDYRLGILSWTPPIAWSLLLVVCGLGALAVTAAGIFGADRGGI